jgi:hypothetical protein
MIKTILNCISNTTHLTTYTMQKQTNFIIQKRVSQLSMHACNMVGDQVCLCFRNSERKTLFQCLPLCSTTVRGSTSFQRCFSWNKFDAPVTFRSQRLDRGRLPRRGRSTQRGRSICIVDFQTSSQLMHIGMASVVGCVNICRLHITKEVSF